MSDPSTIADATLMTSATNEAEIDKSGSRVQRMFSQIAPRYDLLNHLLSLNVDRFWRWRMTRLVPAEGQLPILDLCTGTGDLALAYDRSTGGGVPVVGADFCHEMLEIAKQKANRRGRGDNVTFLHGDTENLPFESNAYQLVTAAFGLRNVSDTARGLQEMVRVCAPRGQVAVLEFTTPRFRPWRAVYLWYFRNILPRIGQLLMRNTESAYDYLPASVGAFPQYEELTAMMKEAGLGNVRYHPFTLGVATLYVGEKSKGDSMENECLGTAIEPGAKPALPSRSDGGAAR